MYVENLVQYMRQSRLEVLYLLRLRDSVLPMHVNYRTRPYKYNPFDARDQLKFGPTQSWRQSKVAI